MSLLPICDIRVDDCGVCYECKIKQLEQQNKILMDAVEFYAEHKVLNERCSEVHNGFGAIARQALQDIKELE